MGPEQQPTTPPAEPTPPNETQPPIMGAIGTQKKKSRKRLIIGIVVGSLAVIALVTGLLLYFLVLKNPQRAIEESVVNAIMAKNYATEGRVTVETKDKQKVSIQLKASQADKSSELQAEIKFSASAGGESLSFTLPKVNVRNVDDAVYVKLDDVKSAVEAAIEAYADQMSSMTRSSANRDQVNSFKEAMMKQAEPIIKEIDNQWIKISLDDLGQAEEAKCVLDVFKQARTDASLRDEIVKAYRQNNFLQIKNDLGTKDGLRGFEIDLGSATVEKRQAFAKALTETTFAKKLKECGGDSANSVSDEISATATDTSLKLWIDTSKNQIRRVELNGSTEGNKVSLETGVMYDSAKDTEAPSDAKDLKEVIKKLQSSSFSDLVPGGSTSTVDVEENEV